MYLRLKWVSNLFFENEIYYLELQQEKHLAYLVKILI